MNKIDDILEGLKGQQPMIDDPDALTDRIMNSLPDMKPSRQEDEGKARIVSWRWPAILAAAASIAVALMIVWPKPEYHPEEPDIVAQVVHPETQKPTDMSPKPLDTPSEHIEHIVLKDEKASKQVPQSKEDQPIVEEEYQRAEYLPLPESANKPRLHYAAIRNIEDSTYQDPAHMDEFIVKMAEYNQVKAVALDCTSGSGDSAIISKAYVFEDKQEMDLFGRLLQAACWYDNKTPGYLLNFSHQQFFFTLKDLRKGQKYLWIAERLVGERILLFSSHSPIEANVSSACYQNYREQLTHNISTLDF